MLFDADYQFSRNDGHICRFSFANITLPKNLDFLRYCFHSFKELFSSNGPEVHLLTFVSPSVIFKRGGKVTSLYQTIKNFLLFFHPLLFTSDVKTVCSILKN